ncbi:membrane-associated protein, putative [Bodo saltans]|uniref:Membrane-associated protein, putative n=1 Tax=Bodo saltans TaxID=75058 RepID=A0A0S4JLU0_BODSA|nr:membrane-associated protein, putative [Bodo saltans]|eukprot:CUG91090.1 membrane-associated protein, putative [Bodo saltans]
MTDGSPFLKTSFLRKTFILLVFPCFSSFFFFLFRLSLFALLTLFLSPSSPVIAPFLLNVVVRSERLQGPLSQRCEWSSSKVRQHVEQYREIAQSLLELRNRILRVLPATIVNVFFSFFFPLCMTFALPAHYFLHSCQLKE